MHPLSRFTVVVALLAISTASGAMASRVPAQSVAPGPAVPDSLRGRSGGLRAAVLLPPDSEPTASPTAGARSARVPAVSSIADTASGGRFAFIELPAFAET